MPQSTTVASGQIQGPTPVSGHSQQATKNLVGLQPGSTEQVVFESTSTGNIPNTLNSVSVHDVLGASVSSQQLRMNQQDVVTPVQVLPGDHVSLIVHFVPENPAPGEVLDVSLSATFDWAN